MRPVTVPVRGAWKLTARCAAEYAGCEWKREAFNVDAADAVRIRKEARAHGRETGHGTTVTREQVTYYVAREGA